MNKKITFSQALLTGIGLVIGSGIFFRAPRILKATEDNVSLAILGWIVLGIALAFAGVGVAVLAARSNREGGIVGYMEDIYGKTGAFLTGWFTTTIYIPLLIGVLGIVAADFLISLLGLTSSAFMLVLLAAILICATFLWNFLSTKFAALFSSAATIIKLFPIVLFGLVGMFSFNSETAFGGFSTFNMALFTAPFISMAFAMDGWTTVATLSRDMENPKKDISKVLALVLIIVTICYTVYFTGVTMMMPADEILAAGNDHVGMIATNILGGAGSKIIVFCVVMSVMGTLNGNVMGGFRYPHALAQNKDLPNSEYFVQESQYGTTGRAAIISFVVTALWFVGYAVQAFAKEAVDTAAQESGNYLLGGIAFDDIPIMWISVVVLLLLVGTLMVGMKEGVGVLKGIIAPVIGIIGQAYIIFSFAQGNPQWILYTVITIVIIGAGLVIRSIAHKQNKVDEA